MFHKNTLIKHIVLNMLKNSVICLIKKNIYECPTLCAIFITVKISYPEMSIKERVAKETLTNFF